MTLRIAPDPFPAPRPSARVARVAELLDCDEGDVRRLVDRGELEAHGLGKRGLRVYLDSVASYQAGKPRAPKRPVDNGLRRPSAARASHAAAERELRKAGIIP